MEEVNRLRHDPSMEEERLKPVLDLTDCMEAFSVKEVLDGAQAWWGIEILSHLSSQSLPLGIAQSVRETDEPLRLSLFGATQTSSLST